MKKPHFLKENDFQSLHKGEQLTIKIESQPSLVDTPNQEIVAELKALFPLPEDNNINHYIVYLHDYPEHLAFTLSQKKNTSRIKTTVVFDDFSYGNQIQGSKKITITQTHTAIA